MIRFLRHALRPEPIEVCEYCGCVFDQDGRCACWAIDDKIDDAKERDESAGLRRALTIVVLTWALIIWAAVALAGERITPELWLEAQAHAARLVGLYDYDPHSIHIVMAPLDRVREIAGDRSPHACAFMGDARVLYCRDDWPWQSDRTHSFGIIVHEAMHSLQPNSMPPGCREAEAHAVQVAWLRERGENEIAADVARNAGWYQCGGGW